MARFSAILKETWWVWLVLVGGGSLAGCLLSPIFYSAIPISLFSLIYFAIMRFDEDGKPRKL